VNVGETTRTMELMRKYGLLKTPIDISERVLMSLSRVDDGPARSFLRIRGLRKAFAAPGGTTVALNGVDLDIERGSFVSIVGPPAAASRPCCRSWPASSPRRRARVLETARWRRRRRTSSTSFQQYTRSLFPWKTVERNVAFGLESRESLSRRRSPRARASSSAS
jgi:NitT/TauT family transport system ATP-binding protein